MSKDTVKYCENEVIFPIRLQKLANNKEIKNKYISDVESMACHGDVCRANDSAAAALSATTTA